MLMLVAWFAFALVAIAIGLLCDVRPLVMTGAVMVLCLSMVASVGW